MPDERVPKQDVDLNRPPDVTVLTSDVELFFRSVATRWKHALEGASRVLILSPYLTSKTADVLLMDLPSAACEIYTRFRSEDFASGASSIDTLIRLEGRGIAMYDLPLLHAKIVLVPGSFASVGSQNLTRQGTRNREATAVFTSPVAVNELQRMVEFWIKHRRRITPEMIVEMADEIGPIRRLMRKAQFAAAALDQKIQKSECARAAERARRAADESKEVELQKLAADEAMRVRLSKKIESVRRKLDFVHSDGGVDEAAAVRFVEESAWWRDHPSGCGHVRAPRHGHRVRGSRLDWTLKFGANTFHVGHAIRDCNRRVREWLARLESGEAESIMELRQRLSRCITGHVSNRAGGVYEDYPADGYNKMRFGTNAIDIDDFACFFLKLVGIFDQFGYDNPKL